MSNDNLFSEHHTPGELLDELGSLKALLDEEHESVIPYTSVSEIRSVEDYLQIKQQAERAGVGVEEYLHQQAEAQQSRPADEGLELYEDDGDEEDVPPLGEVYFLEETDEEVSEGGGDSLLREMANDNEEVHTLSTDEATTVEEYFAAVAAAKRPHGKAPPRLDEKVDTTSAESQRFLADADDRDALVPTDEAIPVLDEVFTTDETIPVLDEVAADSASDAAEVMSLEDVQELVDLIVSRKLEQMKAGLEKEVMGELQKLLPPATYTKP